MRRTCLIALLASLLGGVPGAPSSDGPPALRVAEAAPRELLRAAAAAAAAPAANGTLALGVTNGTRPGRLEEAGMLGVIPFYGALALVYVPLTALFGWRLKRYLGYSIELQRALFGVLLANCAYVVLAFSYYLHLNLDTDADPRVVYGGIYAGFYRWDPFATTVATYHALLVAGAQVMLTLVCDGYLVISTRVRLRTALFLLALAACEFALLGLQRPLHERIAARAAPAAQFALTLVWLAWMCCTTWGARQQLLAKVALALEEAASADATSGGDAGGGGGMLRGTLLASSGIVGSLGAAGGGLAAGGAGSMVLKATLYRRLCCAVGVYPLLLFVALMVFLFNHDWQWMWVRLVMFDLWMLLVLGPAAWTWMPQTSSVKYAPLASEAELEMGMFGDMPDATLARSASGCGFLDEEFDLQQELHDDPI